MKLVIVGYGKMGKAIEKVAIEKNIPIEKIIKNFEELESYTPSSEDVAIEFTTPEACLKNLKLLTQKGIPTVCGTTAWYDHINELKELVAKNNSSFIYGENFAIGVHMFWRTLKEASQAFSKQPTYSSHIEETHNSKKKDAPSGTAKKTLEVMRENNITDEINIKSHRIEDAMGQHIVTFESDEDTVQISHTSKGRAGYAAGAIECAKWIQNKKGFFDINDYLEDIY